MPEQMFSDDNDVLPETEPIRASEIAARGCLAWLVYKIGCLLLLLAMILFVGLIAKFNL